MKNALSSIRGRLTVRYTLALALIVLCHELGDGASLPFFNLARSAAIKLESALNLILQRLLRRRPAQGAGRNNVLVLPLGKHD